MDRREALKGMAVGAMGPLTAAGYSGEARPSEPFCPERFDHPAEFDAWLAARSPSDRPTIVEFRETDIRQDGSGWSWKNQASIDVPGDAPRTAVADDCRDALAAVFADGVWPFVSDRPFWAVPLHDGYRFYQTDTDGAFYRFAADGNCTAFKGAPKNLP